MLNFQRSQPRPQAGRSSDGERLVHHRKGHRSAKGIGILCMAPLLFFASAYIGPRQAHATIPGHTLVETVIVPVTGASVLSTTVLATGVTYKLRASGTFAIGGICSPADSEYACFDNPPVIDKCINEGTDIGIGVNDTVLDAEKSPFWGEFAADHIYTINFVGLEAPINLDYHDCAFSDNSGSLTVEIFAPLPQPVPVLGAFGRVLLGACLLGLVIARRARRQ